MAKWYEETGRDGSNVIVSRVRLVRNWKEYPFPGKMTREESREMTGRLSQMFGDIGALDDTRFERMDLERLSDLQKTALMERRAINKAIAKKKQPCTLLLSEDERVSLVLNGDDHIRIQTMEPGLHLDACYERANRLDDYMEQYVDYAFDEKYGYLTAFPTNVGTGLRATVILHLPSLSRQKNFGSLAADMGRFGTQIKGVYGEGGENFGSLYRVSNQKTLGQTEQEILDLVRNAATELNAQEKKLREEEKKQRSLGMADEAYKSYGVLKYARRLTRKDALEFLSHIMAALNDGIMTAAGPSSIYSLMTAVQPAHLLRMAKKPLNKEEIEIARAEYLREHLPELLNL